MTDFITSRGSAVTYVRPKHFRYGGYHVEAECARIGIHGSVTPCHTNPSMHGHDKNASLWTHWSVVIVKSGGYTIPKNVVFGHEAHVAGMTFPTMGVFFTMGHKTVDVFMGDDRRTMIPTPGLVVGSLMDDLHSMAYYDGPTPWKEWAETYDLSDGTDALIAWAAITEQNQRFRAFLGDDFDTVYGAWKLDEGVEDWDDDPFTTEGDAS